MLMGNRRYGFVGGDGKAAVGIVREDDRRREMFDRSECRRVCGARRLGLFFKEGHGE
jgi:hypothetical protein